MKDYEVNLSYLNENKIVKIRAPNIRFLKSVLDKMLIQDEKLIHVNFYTCKGYYGKANHQNWLYLRGF